MTKLRLLLLSKRNLVIFYCPYLKQRLYCFK